MIIEIIPYSDVKERIKIVSQELEKNRHIEVWDGYIYSQSKGRSNALQIHN